MAEKNYLTSNDMDIELRKLSGIYAELICLVELFRSPFSLHEMLIGDGKAPWETIKRELEDIPQGEIERLRPALIAIANFRWTESSTREIIEKVNNSRVLRATKLYRDVFSILAVLIDVIWGADEIRLAVSCLMDSSQK